MAGYGLSSRNHAQTAPARNPEVLQKMAADPISIIRAQIKRTFRVLQDEDGLSTGMLADLLGYVSPEMVYKIGSPNAETLPGADHLIYASQRLAEFGNLRLARLGLTNGYVIKPMESQLTNGCLTDEYRDMNRAFIRLEDSADACDWATCEKSLDELGRILARARAEVARKKGQQLVRT